MFGFTGSLLLHMGFLQLRQAGTTSLCGQQASLCGGFSCLEHRLQELRLQYLQNVGSCLWFVGPRAWAQHLLCMGSESLHRNKLCFFFCLFVFFFKETEIIKKGSKQGVCCWFSGWDSILSLLCLDSVLVRELRSLKLCNEAEKEKESSRNSF